LCFTCVVLFFTGVDSCIKIVIVYFYY
jgi:hypothetical protein